MMHDYPTVKQWSVSYAPPPSGKEAQHSPTARGKNAWTTLKPSSLPTIHFQMKVSELSQHLRSFLQQHPDCDVKLYCESVVYDDVFDSSSCETITDVRVVNDWPLPGESIIVGNAEEPGKYLVVFYDSERQPPKRPQRIGPAMP